MTPTDRARLRALCEAATKGEWIAKTFKTAYLSTGGGEHEVRDRLTRSTVARVEYEGPEDKAESVANCELIAAAKTALPELLGENEALEKEVAELREALRRCEPFVTREANLWALDAAALPTNEVVREQLRLAGAARSAVAAALAGEGKP